MRKIKLTKPPNPDRTWSRFPKFPLISFENSALFSSLIRPLPVPIGCISSVSSSNQTHRTVSIISLHAGFPKGAGCASLLQDEEPSLLPLVPTTTEHSFSSVDKFQGWQLSSFPS